MVSFSISDERLKKIDLLIEKGLYPHRTACVEDCIDFRLRDLNTKKIINFLYFITLPLFFFLICVGLTLYLVSLFFYILTAISGVYLIVFSFLYYDKYREVKYADNN